MTNESTKENSKAKDAVVINPNSIVRTVGGKIFRKKDIKPSELEKETLKRIRAQKKEKVKPTVKKVSPYLKLSSQYFSTLSKNLLKKESFKHLGENLVKANLSYTPNGYLSITFMTTALSIIVAFILFGFFLFYNFGAVYPFITRASESLGMRFLKTFWLIFAVPISTFFLMYIYPSLEKSNAESAINAELPFATISMSAISGSMVDPIKIFEILISTEEYPAIKKEFTKMINEINLYGYDFVSALKNTAENSSSKKLSELLNGLATTINSGGNLQKFFEKRAQTFLFNYRLGQEKQSKAAETTMDIYISLLIAAPMILMLLLIIMKLSGIGITMSFSAITVMMVLGVSVVNVIFLAFLNARKSE